VFFGFIVFLEFIGSLGRRVKIA